MSEHTEIRIEDFQFQSLRKFMLPIYWKLRHAEQLSSEAKSEVIKSSIREFFIRIRKFRHLTIEEMAIAVKTSTQDLEAFEAGSIKSAELERAYCERCYAWHELDYFERRVRECRDPETRTQKEGMAKDLLKRHGILLPDVNLSRLNAPPAQVVEISKYSPSKVSDTDTDKA